MANKKKTLCAAIISVAAAASSQSAYAQCSATGSLVGLADIVDFSGGAAINSAVSAINAVNTAFLTQSTAFIGSPASARPDQDGGGVWARGVSGEFDTKNRGSGTFAVNGAGISDTVTCDSRTRLSFAGYQVGSDMARLNWNGWNVHFGGTAGYLSSRAQDRTLAGPLNGPGRSTGTIDVPFAGVYAAATYRGFFIDGQIRWDYYESTISNTPNGLFGQRFNGHGAALTANAGYNLQIGNRWFVEPSAGIVASRVKLDPIGTSGGPIVGIGQLPTGSFQADPINSTLGRLSVRAGTTIETASIIWQPFATLSIFHDFEPSVTSNVNVPAPSISTVIDARVQTSSLGTYGQYGIGVAGQLAGTGWLGYARGDYRNGSNIEGYGVNAGLRYQFSPDALPSVHKDLITKAPEILVAHNWTGFYVGGNIGTASGRSETQAAGSGPAVTNKFAGVIGGMHAGYDHQIDKWVLGVEGSFSGSNATGARNCSGYPFIYNCENDLIWHATAAARVGYAWWDRSFIFAKGGLAVGNSDNRLRCNTGSLPLVTTGALPAGCPVASTNDTRTGWTVGGGSEFALTRSWSVKGETMYFDLGRKNFKAGAVAGLVSEKTTGFISTVGLSYRFN